MRISVCLATYNGAGYIYTQIASILPQLGTDDEIVITDDGSIDETVSIIESFEDSRIKIFKGPCKGHPRYNFENGLKLCSGTFIFLCDQDDVWESNKVEVFMRYLLDNDLVTSDCITIDGDGEIISNSFQSLKSYKQDGFWNNLKHNHYLGCCMAFRRSLLDVILPFPTKIAQHDIWIGLCAEAFHYRIRFIPDKLMQYRRYDNNFSHGSDGYSIAYKLSYRLYMLWHVFIRKIRRITI